MENLKILIEFRNYTIMKYFQKISKNDFESRVLEKFPTTINFLNLSEGLENSKIFQKIEQFFNLQLELIGVYNFFEDNKDVEDKIELMEKFNQAFFYVEKKIVENEKYLI